MIISKIPTKIPPILVRCSVLRNNNIKPLSTYHKVCLSYVIPHGITDLFVYPREISLFNYYYTFIFYSFYPKFIKYLLLTIFSVYHVRNDIYGGIFLKYLYTIGIHSSWVFFPEWSLTYLSWIHTTLHYMRVMKLLNNYQKLFILFLTISTFHFLGRVNINDVNKEVLWIPLVIGHVINSS